MHVVIAGGGTAGHIEPALNTADAIRKRWPDATISVLGTERGLEVDLVPARGYELTLIPAVPLPRRPDAALLSLPVRLSGAIGKVRAHLRSVHADVLVGFGGYVALPAYLAARAEGIPIVVHEANAKPGLANRVGAKFAAAVVETVANSLSGAQNLGLPLRETIVNFDKSVNRQLGLDYWKLDPEKRVLLIFGGSQGARHINEVALAAAEEIGELGIQVLHAVGKKNLDQLTEKFPWYRTVPYIDRMDYAYGVADFALSRAGAMTVAELTAVGLPAIYVPLPIGNGEQRLNALPVVAKGGGVVLEDSELTVDTLIAQLKLWNQADLPDIQMRAAACGRKSADAELVDLIAHVAGVQ